MRILLPKGGGLVATKSEALERLQRSLDAIQGLRRLPRGSQEFTKWHRDTKIAIANTFGKDEQHVADFTEIRYTLTSCTMGTPDSAWEDAYRRGLDCAEPILRSMIEEIREYWPEKQPVAPLPRTLTDTVDSNQSNVFVVHGHDDSARESVARVLTKLGLNPIILHEQPNEGRTLVEKFESHADVSFAVVLLTPDDCGGRAGDDPSLRPRARQNVILELGYFMGRLGRERVCALVKGDLERPSDIVGVVYVPMDDERAWEMRLVRELKARNFDVDANLLI